MSNECEMVTENSIPRLKCGDEPTPNVGHFNPQAFDRFYLAGYACGAFFFSETTVQYRADERDK